MLIFSLPVPRWKGDNDLPSNSNISKMAKVANIAFTRTFCKYSISFLVVCGLVDFALVVLKLLMFLLKFVELLASQKSSCSIFPVLKGLNKFKTGDINLET